MKMQDNEFDDLFRSKLDDLEMEPSAQVWQNIDTELDGKKRSRGIFPLLRIAASILILITAGILIIPKKVKNNTDQPKNNRLSHTRIIKQVVTKPGNDAPVKTRESKEEQVAAVQPQVRPAVRVNNQPKKAGASIAPVVQPAPVIAKTEAVKVEEQPVLAAATEKPVEITKPVVPGIETPLVQKQTDAGDESVAETKPVLASAQTPAAGQAKQPVRRHGIHNFGDLVNLVVAKVDKRKDKVIEFTDTDDDGTTITGVHIGSINIKKDR